MALSATAASRGIAATPAARDVQQDTCHDARARVVARRACAAKAKSRLQRKEQRTDRAMQAVDHESIEARRRVVRRQSSRATRSHVIPDADATRRSSCATPSAPARLPRGSRSGRRADRPPACRDTPRSAPRAAIAPRCCSRCAETVARGGAAARPPATRRASATSRPAGRRSPAPCAARRAGCSSFCFCCASCSARMSEIDTRSNSSDFIDRLR